MNVKRRMYAVTLVSTLWGLIGVSVRKDTNWQGMAKHAKVKYNAVVVVKKKP